MYEGQEQKGTGELEDYNFSSSPCRKFTGIFFLLKLSFSFLLLLFLTKISIMSWIISYQIKKAEKFYRNAKRNEYTEDSYALLEVN